MKKDIYCIIIETKTEQPLIGESYLGSSYDDIYERYSKLKSNPEVIRIAIGKVEYNTGNETLFGE